MSQPAACSVVNWCQAPGGALGTTGEQGGVRRTSFGGCSTLQKSYWNATTMKWITRERVKVDRVACPWLIRKFVDKDAEFFFVPADKVMDEAQWLGATPFDVKGVEIGHHGKECSFEAILKKYNLDGEPALVLLGKIVNGADTDNTLWNQPESAGLEAIAEGFRHLGFEDDHKLNSAAWIVYDALYAYCQEMVRQGKPGGMFK
jgi:hypothetical protein